MIIPFEIPFPQIDPAFFTIPLPDMQLATLEIHVRPTQTGDLAAPQPGQRQLPRMSHSVGFDRSE